MPPFTLHFDLDADLVTVTITGTVDHASILQLATNIFSLAIQENCSRILMDCRQANFKLSTLEIYHLPQQIAQLVKQLGRSINEFKRALLILEQQTDAAFIETVSQNQFQLLKAFTDMQAAKEWLLVSLAA